MPAFCTHQTPIGPLALAELNDTVIRVWFPIEIPPLLQQTPTPLLKTACHQLDEYFNGKRKTFSFPQNPGGTPFQHDVWSTIVDIPFGQTRTYGEIARIIGRPKAARAVGLACKHNPLVVIIPCHRVTGVTGLGGFLGGESMKRTLLEREHKQATCKTTDPKALTDV